MLQGVVFSSAGATPLAMAALFVPLPAISLLLVIRPVKRPGYNIALAYLAYSLLLLSYPQLGLAGIACLTAIGAWFGIAAEGALGRSQKILIRPLTAMMMGTVVVSQGLGAVFVKSATEWILVLPVASFMVAFLTLKYVPSSLNPSNRTFSLSDLKLPIWPFAAIVSVYITAGIAEAEVLGVLHELGLGAETYGWFLVAHSISSIFALCTPSFRGVWIIWVSIWYLSITVILLSSILYAGIGYAGLGASGAVLMREFRFLYLTKSENPAGASAFVSLVLSGCLATGAVLGGFGN